MAEIKDFMAPALRRSLEAVRDVSVRFDVDTLIIGLRAFSGFRPHALRGHEVVLRTDTLEGWREIRGRIVPDPRQPRHGTWYDYRFVPDIPHEIYHVIDSDRCHWTNVERVGFASPSGVRSVRNRLYRPESGKDGAKVR